MGCFLNLCRSVHQEANRTMIKLCIKCIYYSACFACDNSRQRIKKPSILSAARPFQPKQSFVFIGFYFWVIQIHQFVNPRIRLSVNPLFPRVIDFLCLFQYLIFIKQYILELSLCIPGCLVAKMSGARITAFASGQ